MDGGLLTPRPPPRGDGQEKGQGYLQPSVTAPFTAASNTFPSQGGQSRGSPVTVGCRCASSLFILKTRCRSFGCFLAGRPILISDDPSGTERLPLPLPLVRGHRYQQHHPPTPPRRRMPCLRGRRNPAGLATAAPLPLLWRHRGGPGPKRGLPEHSLPQLFGDRVDRLPPHHRR